MTSNADLSGYLGCLSTGIPRPLSLIRIEPLMSRVISIQSACPATASSMELSRISPTRWCRARSSVPPIYIPGRLRTGSKPSSTSIDDASYVCSFGAVEPPNKSDIEILFVKIIYIE